MRDRLAIATAVLFVLLASLLVASSAQGPKDPYKGWIDYVDLKQTERLKERPGNYAVLAAVAEFFDGLYAIRPDYSRCAYPLQLDSGTYASWDEVQKELDARANDGGRQKNAIRSYNVIIRSCSIHSAESFSESVEFKKLHKHRQKRFGEVRKRHPGRAVMVLVHADLESLESPKVEGSEVPLILYLVHAKKQWQVAWFDK
jgi:hypothetical protein